MMQAAAGFGEYFGRNSDGDAGAKTFWMGLLKLANFTHAAQVLINIK